MTMYGNVNTPFGRGFTYFMGDVPDSAQWKQSARIEGVTGEFSDLKPRSGVDSLGAQELRGPRPQKGRVVRNVSTIRVKPRRAVVWAAGYRDKRIDGYQHSQYGEIAGIVDEHLPEAGVAVGDLFWLIQGGQVLATTDGGAETIDVGDKINAATGTSSLNDDAGRIEASGVTAGATDATYAQQFNICGTAVWAKAATETDKQLLVNLTLV